MQQYQFSLVFFTVLTQWSIGSVFAITLYRSLFAKTDTEWKYDRKIALLIWAVCAIGSTSSLAHLGSPLQAYNALRGLGSSWMSREVVAFGMLNGLMTLWAASHFFNVKLSVQKLLGTSVAAFGLFSVAMSGQIYFAVEHRPEWNTVLTHLAFVGTAFMLGMASLIAFLKLSNQSIPSTIRYLLGISVVFVFIVMMRLSLITGLDTNGFLIIYRLFASVLVGVGLFMLAGDSIQKQSAGLIVAVTLLMVSGEIAGRMSFYSSVMSQTPW